MLRLVMLGGERGFLIPGQPSISVVLGVKSDLALVVGMLGDRCGEFRGIRTSSIDFVYNFRAAQFVPVKHFHESIATVLPETTHRSGILYAMIPF